MRFLTVVLCLTLMVCFSSAYWRGGYYGKKAVPGERTPGQKKIVRRLNCGGQADGVYEYTCFYYKECKSGSVVRTNCSKTEVYDRTKSQCVTPVKGYWPCQDAKDCLHAANGMYPDIKAGCSSFYTCHNGYFYGHNYCPDGLVFDDSAQLCNWKRNVGPPCGSLGVVA